jgi:hypothetical protein
MQRDIFRVPDDGQAALISGVEQILHHLLLAIDRDGAAAGQASQVDTEQVSIQSEVDAAMDQTFPIQPTGKAELAHQIDGDLLQHASTDAPLHIGPVAALYNDGGDSFALQQVGKKHARRAGADDRDLCPHETIPYRPAFGVVLLAKKQRFQEALHMRK